MDFDEQLASGRRTSERGVAQATIVNPSRKLLLINEDPGTMHNASFYPAGSAAEGVFTLHNGRVNMGFVDGHIEAMKHRKVLEIQQRNQIPLWFDPF